MDGSSSVPVIDISPWLEPNESSSVSQEEKERVCNEIQKACCQWGFFVIVGLPTSLTDSIIPNAANESRRYFASSSKQSCCHGNGAYGYFEMESESLTNENDDDSQASKKKYPDLREAWSMGPVTNMSNRLSQLYQNDNDRLWYRGVIDFCYQTTPWPSDEGNNTFQSCMTDFFMATSNVGRVLLQIVARCLNLPETYFQEASMEGEHCNSARAIWYPKLKTEAMNGQYRCGPHTDSGVLTLLWTDGLGLEIQLSNEEWIPITNLQANSLLINIGDLLQEASGHIWRSTPHRVLAPKLQDTEYNQDRLVLVLFVILAADFPIPNMTLTQGEYLYRQFQKWKQV